MDPVRVWNGRCKLDVERSARTTITLPAELFPHLNGANLIISGLDEESAGILTKMLEAGIAALGG